MRPRVPRRARFFAQLVFALSTASAPLASAVSEPFEFWVVEPNEGDAAGGHAAIRIAESVFHVQRRPDGLLMDWRTPRARFEEVYRGLGNRSIEAIPLSLDAPGRERLREALERRFFERRRMLRRFDALEREAAWLEEVVSRGRGSVEVPGSGLIDRARRGCNDDDTRHLARFNRVLATRHGEPWLAQRLAEANRVVEHLTERIASSHEETVLPTLVDALRTRDALEMLVECRRPASNRLIAVPEATPVDAAGKARLREIAGWLEARLHALLTSRREDAGLAMILTAARWTAVEDSLSTGHLIVIDPLAEPSGSLRALEGGFPDPWLIRLADEARDRLAKHVAELGAGSAPLEARLGRIEFEVHRMRHLRERTLHSTPEHWTSGTASPDRRYVSRIVALPRPTGLPVDIVAGRRNRIRALSRETRRSLEAELRYSLWSRNCVTELTRFLDLDDRDPWSGLDFIPVVAGHQVANALAAGPSRPLPSARRGQLATHADIAGGAGGAWREWTTLTSRTYRPNPADSTFLFFSRERFWSRPLLGVSNLIYGAGGVMAGLVSAPIDRGEHLRRGLLGVVMSVPELFFFSVRQGSYPIAPPRRMITPEGSTDEHQ